MKESKLLTKRMKHIIKILEEHVVNNGTEDAPILVRIPMTIEQIADVGIKMLDEKGICNKYTYSQVGASIYLLFRRGIIEIENIPNLENPTVYSKDTIIILK